MKLIPNLFKPPHNETHPQSNDRRYRTATGGLAELENCSFERSGSAMENWYYPKVEKSTVIDWNDFLKVDFRVGTVPEVQDFPQARRPALVLRVDFGPDLGIKKCSAQITDLYSSENLLGRQVIAVVNLPPKQIGPLRSECLVTGFHRKDGSVVLAVPQNTVPDGARLS